MPARDRSKNGVVELPLLPRRDTIVFPRMTGQFIIMRPSSVNAVEAALEGDRRIIVAARRNLQAQEVHLLELYSVGTEATVHRMMKLPDGSTSIWVEGTRRVHLKELVQEQPFFRVKATALPEPRVKSEATEAMKRAVLALFEKCVKLSPDMTEDVYVAAMNAESPGWLADLIASTISIDLPQRQEILELLDPDERLLRVNQFLAREVDILELRDKIQSQVHEEMDKGHREYFLREQLRIIQKELGEKDPLTREMDELGQKIESSGMNQAAHKKALEELERLRQVPPASPETVIIRTYLDWLVRLPWKENLQDSLDIKEAARILNQNHYGLHQVKERILEYMAVRKAATDASRTPILCFSGPPGVGKTSLGMSIAQALGRPFLRVSLGGIRDEAEIRGHRRTYVGALPGRIVQTMRHAGTISPVFMLDEIDKVGADFRGDPSAALLEALDPEQNQAFSDHYLEVPYDLSKVLFITTANIVDSIIPALKDRLEIIELPGYTEEEKLRIARYFLIAKQLKQHGLEKTPIKFSAAALRKIIREYTREAGVRNLERELGSISRKIVRAREEGEKAPRQIGEQIIPSYLGPPKFVWGSAEERDEVGVATGVARTEAGGDLLSVEVGLMAGKGNLILTGQLGEVMRESAQAALSYARSRTRELSLGGNPLEERDIHIHVPAGAVPKDGPSAGVTIATALISALTKRSTKREVAMTGEITLRGRVLPVGGIKEKVLAAHRAGITAFILPEQNRKDLKEIPTKVKRQLNFIFVKRMDEVLNTALNPASSETKP